MTGFILLDVAIGVIFSLLVYSLIASALQEAISSCLNWRGAMLRVGIRGLLETSLADAVFEHPSIKALRAPGGWTSIISGNKRPPSSIPPSTFARSVIETLIREYDDLKKKQSSADIALNEIRERVQTLQISDKLKDRLKDHVANAATAEAALKEVPAALDRIEARIDALGLDVAETTKLKSIVERVRDGAASLRSTVPDALKSVQDGIAAADLDDRIRAALTGAADHVGEALEAARAELVRNVESLERDLAKSFEHAMDRVIGWYIRRTKFVLFLLGMAMAGATNFNLLGYTKMLVENEALRERMVARAELVAKTGMLGGREISDVGYDAGAIWLHLKKDSEAATQADIERITQNRALGELATAAADSGEKDGMITIEEANAAYEKAWLKVADYDENNDRILDAEESAAAAKASLIDLRREVVEGLKIANSELADQGVPLGWKCTDQKNFFKCIGANLTLAALLSWVIIGLGCTLGGQFWYDMLTNLLKVRAAGAGVKSEDEKPKTA